MTKPWGRVGTWAAAVEAEDEIQANSPHLAAESQSFPSLKEAVATKPQKKKKNTMTLAELHTGTNVGQGARGLTGTSGLTTDEILRLPTGPRERSAEEMEFSKGGFRTFSRPQGPPGGRMDGGSGSGDRRDRDSSWGGAGRRSYGGGFDDERRSAPPRESDLPSRADEDDNWAMGKKSAPPMDFGRGGDTGGRGDRDRYSALGGGSRADEVDNWAMGKKPIPVRSPTSGFGSSFRDRDREPLGPEPDRWARTGPLPSRDADYPPSRERTRLVLNPPTGDGSLNESAKSTRPSPFGAARPREEILAEKGFDYKKLDSEIDTKKTTSRPTSAQSTRPSSAHSNQPENTSTEVLEVAAKPRPKVNPFGDAKPREVLLQEKGKDWRKIDFELEHRSVDRPETREEQVLKEEIDFLKKQLDKEAAININGEQTGLQEQIHAKERDLELLIRELDDKVRFGQKATERPGSGAGRSSGFSERPGSGGRNSGISERPGSGAGRSTGFPPSQSGVSDEFRNVEHIDRPGSRGTVDVWTRPVDDRRSFQGGREGGFLRSREDRPRW